MSNKISKERIERKLLKPCLKRYWDIGCKYLRIEEKHES